RALLAMFGVLIVTTPAALLGGCTGMTTGSTPTTSMAPAPRAKVTAGTTSYTPVTDQRLVNPEPENWLMYRRTHDGGGHSPLQQTPPGQARSLAPAGAAHGHAPPRGACTRVSSSGLTPNAASAAATTRCPWPRSTRTWSRWMTR